MSAFFNQRTFLAAFILLSLAFDTSPVIAGNHASNSLDDRHELNPLMGEGEYSPLLALLVGEFSAWRGDSQQALGHYQQAIKLVEPGDHAALASRATKMAYKQQDFEAMLGFSQSWVESEQSVQEQAQAFFFYAVALNKNTRFPQAMQAMRKAGELGHETDFTRLVNQVQPVQFDDADEYRRYLLTRSHTLSDYYDVNQASYDLPLAMALVAVKEDDIQRANKWVEQAISNGQNQLAVMEFALQIYRSTDNVEGAEQIYRYLLQDEVVLTVEINREKLRHQFALYMTDKDVDVAIEQLLVLAEDYPSNQRYQFHLALIYLEHGRAEQARPILLDLTNGQASKIYAEEAWYYLALLSMEAEAYEEAVAYLALIKKQKLAVKKSKALLQAYLSLAAYESALNETAFLSQQVSNLIELETVLLTQSSIYQLLGRTELALASLDKLQRYEVYSPRVYYQRAMVLYQLKQMDAAELELEMYLVLEPKDIRAMHLLASWIAVDSQRFEEALTWLNKAEGIDPNDVEVLDTTGWVLYRMGRMHEAQVYMQKARSFSEDVELAARFAEVLWQNGEHHQAKELLKEAYAQSPQDKVLTDTMQRLRIVID